MLNGYQAQRGETRNLLYEQQLQKRAEAIQMAGKRICDLVYVYDYDHINQTVSVVLASDRRSLPIRNVPIAGSGGHGVRFIRAWKGLLQTDKPDIGVIVYPRLGGARTFLDFVRRDTNAVHARVEETAIFFGGIPAAIAAGETMVDNLVSGTPLLHQIGKEDNGVMKPSGAGFMVKDNDDIVIRGNRVFFLGMDQVEGDAQAVARQGDAGDGIGGAIAGGSAKIFAG